MGDKYYSYKTMYEWNQRRRSIIPGSKAKFFKNGKAYFSYDQTRISVSMKKNGLSYFAYNQTESWWVHNQRKNQNKKHNTIKNSHDDFEHQIKNEKVNVQKSAQQTCKDYPKEYINLDDIKLPEYNITIIEVIKLPFLFLKLVYLIICLLLDIFTLKEKKNDRY